MENTADVFNSSDQIIWWAAPDDDVICTFYVEKVYMEIAHKPITFREKMAMLT